ncbi:hypothetical protein RRG08_019040 [Elysia crispata]|uniref:Uncharacterized protein n=1 Tax=Elysia crispata TaxID=231223 RepID=A0AAE1A541_9GAST|nr:hypothetical protein RRG08_019040 [Elysia crispata]
MEAVFVEIVYAFNWQDNDSFRFADLTLRKEVSHYLTWAVESPWIAVPQSLWLIRLHSLAPPPGRCSLPGSDVYTEGPRTVRYHDCVSELTTINLTSSGATHVIRSSLIIFALGRDVGVGVDRGVGVSGGVGVNVNGGVGVSGGVGVGVNVNGGVGVSGGVGVGVNGGVGVGVDGGVGVGVSGGMGLNVGGTCIQMDKLGELQHQYRVTTVEGCLRFERLSRCVMAVMESHSKRDTLGYIVQLYHMSRHGMLMVGWSRLWCSLGTRSNKHFQVKWAAADLVDDVSP